jgi:hypothetical protein
LTATESSCIQHTACIGIFRYASAHPYTIVNDLPTVEAAWIDRQGNPANRNSERMPANKTMDLSLGKGFRTAYGTLTPGLEIINLLNWVNVTGVSTSRSSPGLPTAADTSRVMQVSLERKF